MRWPPAQYLARDAEGTGAVNGEPFSNGMWKYFSFDEARGRLIFFFEYIFYLFGVDVFFFAQ